MQITVASWRRVLVGLAAACIAGCMPTEDGVQYNLAGQNIGLTILHTADMHSRLLPYDFTPATTDINLGLAPEAPPFGGATRLAALIKRERGIGDRVIHLDSGDQFEGAPLFNLSTGEPEIRFMSLVNPDAVVIGNHEFDDGARNFVQKYLTWGTYPLLAANYVYPDPTTDPVANQLGQVSRPYVIVNQKGLRIAVIGLGNTDALNSIVRGGNSLQIKPIEQNEAIRQWVQFVAPISDVIVVLSHGGITPDEYLINGYDAYYPNTTNIDEYLNRTVDNWTQVEPTYPDGTRHVWIPGVRSVDVIMGGHVHIVLNPSQELVNPNEPNRRVVLQHSGAFAKYLGRLDLQLHMPSIAEQQDPQTKYNAAEVNAHAYRVFPVDAIWCDDEAHSWRAQMTTEQFTAAIQPRIAACTNQEDQLATWLLEPYILNETVGFNLAEIFAFAPKEIQRYNTSSGGDSPLGNLVAESMRVREGIQAEMGITNSLGIRDDIYAGPINLEDMYNVFPFENTINLQYLSGTELHLLFDYNAARSATRGCQTQAQVAGAKFTMDCATALLNENQSPCMTAQDCQTLYPRPDTTPPTRSPWQCQFPVGTPVGSPGICYAEESYNISINNEPLDLNAQYKVAPNNYIAHGGSGFQVLQRNTTTQESNISLRDGLIEYFEQQCTCDQINTACPMGSAESCVTNVRSPAGLPCGTVITASDPDGGGLISSVDPAVTGYCTQVSKFEQWSKASYTPDSSDGNPITSGYCNCDRVKAAFLPDGGAANDKDPCYNPTMLGYCTGNCPCVTVAAATAGQACYDTDVAAFCSSVPALNAGPCGCIDVLLNNQVLCNHITPELVTFCRSPGNLPMVVGEVDGRIQARVQ